MGSEAEKKSVYNSQRRRFKAVAYFLACIVIALVIVAIKRAGMYFWTSKADLFAQTNGKRVKSDEKREELNLTEFRKCNVSFQPHKAQSVWNTKPIWIPAFPTSLKESTHKSIIKQMTGLDQGGKSYYASAKGGLRFCFGSTETATCSNVHPLTDMAGGPDKKSDKFYSEYIMAIRNPMAAIPAMANEKQNKYHGGTGQMSEDAWRKLRDEWFNNMIKAWVSFIQIWKMTSDYKAGMYLVYEELYDVDEGPKALGRLRGILHAAGFDVAPEVDVPCIWFKSIGEDDLQQNHKINYEYNDYIPGYTKVQKELLLAALSTLVHDYKEDEELASILQRYSNTIMHAIRIDNTVSAAR